jgi:hypothetical protein
MMTGGTPMEQTIVKIAFPNLESPEASERAQDLLDELRQDAELRPHLDLGRTALARTDREAQDFGATLIAVLGTPAIIILARTLKSWAERTGTSTIELNGVHIENVRGQDIARIIKALGTLPPAAPKA